MPVAPVEESTFDRGFYFAGTVKLCRSRANKPMSNTVFPNALHVGRSEEFDRVEVVRLLELLLDEPWHKRCEIIPDYIPPFPRPDTRPTVQIRFNDGTEYPPFLRHSKGPKQGFFWDVYGDDFQDVPLAIVGLAQAPAPVNVGPITFGFKLNERSNNLVDGL